MALGQISLDGESKRLLQRIAGALEKIADGSTKEQVQFHQYITGGDSGFVEEAGHNYVVRFTRCSAEAAASYMNEVIENFNYAGASIEVEKR